MSALPGRQLRLRKPKTQLVLPAGRGTCWIKPTQLIGDRATDLELADNMGITGLRYDRETLDWPTICEQLTRRDRYAHVERITKETQMDESVAGPRGRQQDPHLASAFDHMLDQTPPTAASAWRLTSAITADDHHTVEDTGQALGEALKVALGDKRGINRFGFVLPMDECLARCALDISGRPHLEYKADFTYQRVGDLSTEMVEHFFRSLSYTMAVTLHLKTKGKNDHHRVESLFKAFGRTLRQAIRVQGDALPSSKGVL